MPSPWGITTVAASLWLASRASATEVNTNQAEGFMETWLADAGFTIVQSPVATETPSLPALRAAVKAGNYTSTISPATRSRCPLSCSSTGFNTSDWYVYHDLNRLHLCDSTMLLDFALFNELSDLDTHISIAACTADMAAESKTTSNTTICGQYDANQQTKVSKSLQLASVGAASSAYVSDAVAALDQLQAFVTLSDANCEPSIKFAYSGNVAAGIYAGSTLANQGVIASVLEQLSQKIKADGSLAKSLVVQLSDNSSSRYSLGVYLNTQADLGSVQLGVQSWSNSTYVTLAGATTTAWENITFLAPSVSYSGNSTKLDTRNSLLEHRDDTCTTVQVVSGDSCATLPAECGITAAEFTEYNDASDLCSTLAVGQYVCCSAGTLPDYSPQPDADGYCYSYTVQKGDTCSLLATTYDITVDEIEEWNTETWGWYGCDDLMADYTICLSSGYPPMPAAVANAECGPQVPGTPSVPEGTDLSTLNECPLNACCDIWGQCGVTSDFCTISNSTTGAPGTAAAGQNGCISNCGTTIITSSAPAEIFTIGYFEAYDNQRPCLKMSVDEVDTSAYTHIHFSFGTLNADYSMNTSMIESQLSEFQAMSDVKKILSIGGWDFSTDPSTYQIFRDAVSTDANRQTLIANVVDFLQEYDFDGVDWDWEYPDEPDIPGIPAGTEADSTGYFLLLDELKAAMPSGMTVSLTAPASFWYLQYFPIEAISAVVDYIVFMTYDLHGQWDWNNTYADSGCPDGNCLRSHINLTETLTALSMITKAGVPSNMIAVGVSSYGRSFEMTTAGCYTSMCTYVGPDSGALPGICTETAGYISDYEISLIVAENPSAQSYYDSDSFSNIVVYNETQWVAFMNDSNKAYRTTLYEALTFLGTSDWAIDLQSPDGDGSGSGGDGTYDCTTTYPNSAIVAYATSTEVSDKAVCTGESTTIQAGKTISAQVAADVTLAVGNLTGAPLYTSISSALAAGCSIPTSGVTVTTCTDIPEITGIVWAEKIENGTDGKTSWSFVDPDGEAGNDGKITIDVVVMQVWDQDVLNALISTIAAALQGLSENSTNTVLAYEPDEYTCEKTDCGPTFNYTTVSGVVLAMYTEQTQDTDGALLEQDLEVKLTLETGKGVEYECAIGAFVFDAMASLSIIPGFEWLETATEYITVGAGGMSLTCLVEDEISPDDDGSGDGSGGDDGGGGSASSASNTYTLAPNPDYPCTTTLSNTAIVEYATSTITGGSTICTGSSSTVQAGKSILIQVAQDATVPVGTLTGADLFTSVSSALAAGCTIATEGHTVTNCGDIPKITGITYYETEKNDDTGGYEVVYGGLAATPQGGTDGKIEMDIVLMSVWNQDVLDALITSIAATLQGLSVNASNDIPVYAAAEYVDYPGATYTNYTTVSGAVLAYYTEQTAATDGSISRQDLEVQFTLEADGGDFDCGAGAFVFDALAIIALIPGFEWLGVVAAEGALGMSLTCMLTDEIGSDE